MLFRSDLATILQGIKPFNVILHALTQFNNDEFDVVKFDAESETLRELRQRADKYKNFDRFPDYKPHLTLGYVKPKSFAHTKNNLRFNVLVNEIKYSGADGKIIKIRL